MTIDFANSRPSNNPWSMWIPRPGRHFLSCLSSDQSLAAPSCTAVLHVPPQHCRLEPVINCVLHSYQVARPSLPIKPSVPCGPQLYCSTALLHIPLQHWRLQPVINCVLLSCSVATVPSQHLPLQHCNTFKMKPVLKKILDLSMFFVSNVILNGTDVITDAITALTLCKAMPIQASFVNSNYYKVLIY